MEVPSIGEFGRASDNRKGFRHRCFNRPEFIAIVKKAAGDGNRPEMSLCDGCRKMFVKTNDIKKYNFRRIKR